MKRFLKILVGIVLAVSALALSSCGILSDLNNAVQYPEAYSLSYEVTSEDGTIQTVTKTVDESGNVYYKNADAEAIYIRMGSSYVKYVKNEAGAFEAISESKLTKKAVEDETAGIATYAEESKNKFMPTAKQESNREMLGRTCEVYKLGVGTEENSSYTYYYVDQETGICLGIEVVNTALGQNIAHDGASFVCVEFLLEDIDDISNMINE